MTKLVILIILIIVIVVIILLIAEVPQYCSTLYDYSNEQLVERYKLKPKVSNSRVVISMTSIPERLDYIKPVLNSLFKQTMKVDEIALNIPYTSRKGVKYEIPGWMQQMDKREDIPLKIHRVDEDEGPGTKILPTLRREKYDTLVIAVDDDNIYPSKMVENLVYEFDRYGRKRAITNYGMVMKKPTTGPLPQFPFKYNRILSTMSPSREVDFVQGCTGFIVTPAMFPDQALNIKNGPKEALTVDDIWISGWLKMKKVKIMQPAFNLRMVPLPHVESLKNTPSLIRGENGDRKNDLITIQWFRDKGVKLLYEKEN